MNKVIGLDLGSKTLGIAISDVLGIAHGHEEFVFQENAYKQAERKVLELVKETGIKEIALGYPLNMDGSVGDRARSSEIFKENLLKADPSLTITLVDERLTTVMATSFLLDADISRKKRKKVIDKQAAIVILQSYLDRKANMQ